MQHRGKPDEEKDLTPEQRSMRAEKVATYEAYINASGKRRISSKWSKQLDSIEETMKDTKEDTTEIKQSVNELSNFFKGKATPSDPDQTDAERLRQIGLQQKMLKTEETP